MQSKKTHYFISPWTYKALMVAQNAPHWFQMMAKHDLVPAPA
jgi:hypothetical protein